MPKNVPINFVCREMKDTKVCEVVPPEAHMEGGDKVTLKGNNVDVDIHFLHESPLKSGKNIHLTKGVPYTDEVIDDVKKGAYEYTYTCTEPACPTPSKKRSNPKMIVP